MTAKSLPPASLQQLPPASAHFCLGVERFIRRELGLDPQGRKLLIACSGGLDSVVLVQVLRLLRPRLDCTLAVAHLDHGLRPESGQDAAFVRDLCAALDLPFQTGRSRVGRFAVRSGLGLEDAGRILRYRFLHGVQRRIGADLLVLGHHLNDLAEDVLLRLTRGTGWPALAGMAAYCESRRILRPFLLTPKAELESFARSITAAWTEDASNASPDYRRNRVRHSILPLFQAENPSFLDSVADLWRQGRLDAEYWEDRLAELETVPAASGEVILSRDFLAELHPAMRLRCYKRVLESLGPGQSLTRNLLALERAYLEKRDGRCIQFPGGKTATLVSSGIVFGIVR